MSIKNFIRETFRSCLDILRDSEYLTGDKALRPLGYFLQLRLLEPQFGKEIDIDNPIYYNFRHYENELANNKEWCDKQLAELLRLARFSYLAKVKEDNLKTNLEYVWDDILSVHPATKDVFLKGRGFQLKKQSTYKKIIDKLAAVDFENIDEDILGGVYEEVIKDIMTGKTLGQFFTPPVVKQMMVDLINPQIHSDGTTESIFDPAMGTGGLLITCLRSLISKSKESGVKIKWDILTKNRTISGRECEPDTFQLAVSNMLISSGKKFQLEHGDSIRNPITTKYDIIIANPPFGIKGLEYDEITSPLRNEYLPIKSKSSTPLFLQAIIYMLKVNGRCVVVLPDGQDLFSKSKSLVAVREYLMKTCELKEVIYLPPGMFTHTTIKTCVFFFYKKKEGNEVLELKIKRSDGKETDRSYVFTGAHQTEKVVFSEFDGTNKRVIVEVAIADVAKNNYSLNSDEYLEKTNSAIKIGGGSSGIVVKTLAEVCDFKNGKGIKKESLEPGEYPVIGGGKQPLGYHNKYNTDENVVLCSSSGASAGYISRYAKKVWASDCFSIKPKTNLNNAYLYYFLKLARQSDIYAMQTGTAQPHIYSKNLETIQIPIPSLEKQQEIIDHIERHQECYANYYRINQEKLQTLKHMNELRFQTSAVFGAPVKTLGEVCKVNQGTYIKPDMKINGEYPVYGGGNISFYINSFNRENEIVVAKDGVSADCVRYVSGKFFLNHHGWTISCKENVNKKYMFYVLHSIRSQLLSIAKGTAQLGINQENFYKLTIPIPSLEQQQEIVEFCEANDRLIKQLEEEIEQNEKIAKTIIQDAFAGLATTDETKKRKHGDV